MRDEKSLLKICLLNHGLANGGTDTFVINVAKELKERGHDVTVVMAVDDDNIQFREQEALDYCIHILRTCDLGSIKKIMLHCKRLYKILRDGKFDVFHANMDLFNGFNMAVAKKAKVPVRVCHSHNSQSQYEANTGKHVIVRIYRSIMRWLCKHNSNRYCGCSELAMDYLFPDFWKNDTHAKVIYNGIDFNKFQNFLCAENLVLDKKKSLKVKANHKIIAVIGRFAVQKNPEFIVQIMYELLKLRKDVVLLWVGSGELKKEIENKVKELSLSDYIQMLGSRKDVNEILQCSNALLMPSLFEGLPFTLVEAQVAGVPCLISDTVSEMANCGKCFSMSLTQEPSEWAMNLSDILDGKIVLENNQEKLKQFDLKYMVNQLESVYQ